MLIEMKVVSKDINVWIEADATDGSKEVVQKVRITSIEGWRSFRYSTKNKEGGRWGCREEDSIPQADGYV